MQAKQYNQKTATRCYLKLLTIICILAIPGSVVGQREMSNEEWERYKNRGPEEKRAEALEILNDPTWHERDWSIRAIRESNERNVPEKRTPMEGFIASREDLAMSNLIELEFDPVKRKTLLEKYVNHRTEEVVRRAFMSLVSERIWPIAQAKKYAAERDDPVFWGLMLQALPDAIDIADRKEIAREYLRLVLDELPSEYEQLRGQRELAAVRVLIESPEPRDFDLVRSSVLRNPDMVLLWAAASRLPRDEAVDKLARSVYSDGSKPESVRSAAALVFGKSDPRVTADVLERAVAVLGRVATAEGQARRIIALRDVTTPESNAYYKDIKDAEGFLAVLNELPTDVLASRSSELYRYRFGTFGSGVSAILARKIPRIFVELVTEKNDLPNESRGSLAIAAHFDPTVSAKTDSLLTPEESRQFADQRDKQGIQKLAGVVYNLALWD